MDVLQEHTQSMGNQHIDPIQPDDKQQAIIFSQKIDTYDDGYL
jgi:hypothetical protein